MRARSVLLACVCTAFLAAPAAVGGAIAANQNSPLDLTVAARQALQAGDTATAIAGYSEAIESRQLSPERLANALINRGFAYQQAQEHDRAIDDYTAALRIDAMNGKLRATALYNRGLSQQKLKHPVMAIEDFTSALFLEPEFAHAYYLRGTILRESGQYLFALSDFEKALRFKHPQPHLVHYAEALTYEALQRRNEAEASLKKSVSANPSFVLARNKLAQMSALPEGAASAQSQPDLITASITSPEQIMRKEALPEAVKPPLQLVGDLPVQMVQAVPLKPKKRIVDRIPAEEGLQVVNVEPAAAQGTDYTLQADAIPQPNESKPVMAAVKAAEPEAKPQTEQIVSVEALPEADEQPGGETSESASADPDMDNLTTQSSDAPLTGWSVQLSSAKDEKLAWGTWEKLKSRHKSLGEMKPVVVKADLGKKGVYFRLRLGGFDSQEDAKSACGRLKSRGVTCFVSKLDS